MEMIFIHWVAFTNKFVVLPSRSRPLTPILEVDHFQFSYLMLFKTPRYSC